MSRRETTATNHDTDASPKLGTPAPRVQLETELALSGHPRCRRSKRKAPHVSANFFSRTKTQQLGVAGPYTCSEQINPTCLAFPTRLGISATLVTPHSKVEGLARQVFRQKKDNSRRDFGELRSQPKVSEGNESLRLITLVYFEGKQINILRRGGSRSF